MSKRVVVRRKAAKTVPNRKVPSKKSSKSRAPALPAKASKKKPAAKTAKAAPAKKEPAKKKVVRQTAKAIDKNSRKPAAKATATEKTSRKPAAIPKGKVQRSIKPTSLKPAPLAAKQSLKPQRALLAKEVKAQPKVATKQANAKPAVPSVEHAPATPRSITPPANAEAKVAARVRQRPAAKSVFRGAYISPAQRVLEAQQAAQVRARRAQAQREEVVVEHRVEPAPASEGQVVADSAAVSSEMRAASTGFVRRGRLGPRDPNSGPASETGAPTVLVTGAFDAEWRRIDRLARQLSLRIERESVQGWLEPWLNGKDTLALIQSALDSGTPYLVATQALERKTLLIERTASAAGELAQRYSRLGLKAWALSGSGEERKYVFNQFSTTAGGTLVVPLTAFDDNELVTELLQLKLTGIVAEEAQRISELSFDFDVAYDRLPGIISRLGRPPTLAILRSAPPSVRTDLPHRLGLRNAQRVDLQPLPDTIALEVPVVDLPHRGGTLLERLGQAVAPSLVLCSSPEEVDEVVEILGRASLPFRGSAALSAVGMGHLTTAAHGSESEVYVGISGMPSSRDPMPKTIIHYRAPASLEQYARDLGRLDTTEPGASAIVLAATEDETHVRQWLERQRPRPEDLIQVATLVSQHAGPGKMALVDTLAASFGTGRTRLESLLALLANAGWVEHKMDWVRVPETCTDLLDRARALAARLKSLRERDHQRMRSVSAYVIGRNCRHESMRRHFGTAAQRPCSVCDNCRTKASHAAANGGTLASEPAEASAPVHEPEIIFES